jgi:serine/threonine protein phosphatase PrpC
MFTILLWFFLGLLLGVVVMYLYVKTRFHSQRKAVPVSRVQPLPGAEKVRNASETASSESKLIDCFPITTKLRSCQATIFPPFQHTYEGKGEDCVLAGIAANKWPFIIIADGVTGQIDETSGGVVVGGGGQAAEIVAQAVREFLEDKLQENPGIPSMLKYLREAFQVGTQELNSQGISGATTLLIALLYENSVTQESPATSWLYAFEGDGAIVLLNPAREIDGRMLHTKLLAPPQKMDATAAISSKGATVPPVVGCIRYEPGDIVYLASDGMDGFENFLRKEKRIFLANYIWDYLSKNQDIKQLHNDLAKFCFSDDATLGIIWTSDSGL